jgi:uncharacterized protein YjbI with pentapeptide repeats
MTETGATIRDQDWDGEKLDHQSFERVTLVDVDMTELVNEGSTFDECVFRNVKFNASTHTDAAFLNCVFSTCSLFDVTFASCKLVGSRFERCSFKLLKVRAGDWSFVGLARAQLDGAAFNDVRMRECDLTGASLAAAAIRECDLSAATLDGADFSRCDLRGSDISALDPKSARVVGAIVTHEQAVVIAGALGLDVRADLSAATE